jgi:uncharacterized protein (TIGR03000 family)
MRRIVRPFLDYLVELATRTADGWSRFWFTPVDPSMLGLIRVFTGMMLVYTHAVWGMALPEFFGADGWLGEEAVRSLQSGQFIFSYLWYVPPQWLGTVHAAAMVVLVLFTLGVFTRVTSILSFVILINYAHRVPAALFGLDQINGMLTLYLAVGPSGAAFSIDRLAARYRMARSELSTNSAAKLRMAPPPSVGANIAIRLIQVHMCVIYLFAGMSKLLGEPWWDGTAIWRTAASYEYQSVDLTWLAHVPLLVNVLTQFAALWELSYCVLVWPKLTRPLVLAAAFLIHLSIGVCMGMMTFGLIMIIGNMSFGSYEFVREWVSSLRRRRPLTVVYDGACSLCVRSVSLLKALDTAGNLRLADFNNVDPQSIHPLLTREGCMVALQVVRHSDPQPALFSGYWGFRVIARQTPLLWPLLPAFYLPGAGTVGPFLYRLIAENRVRRAGCYSGACAIHSAGVAGIAKRGRAPVTLTIRLPEDGRLFVQNELYPGQGRQRRFTSTPARYGKDYVFNLRVEVTREGVLHTMSQEVRVRAGQHSSIRFWLGDSASNGEAEPQHSNGQSELVDESPTPDAEVMDPHENGDAQSDPIVTTENAERHDSNGDSELAEESAPPNGDGKDPHQNGDAHSNPIVTTENAERHDSNGDSELAEESAPPNGDGKDPHQNGDAHSNPIVTTENAERHHSNGDSERAEESAPPNGEGKDPHQNGDAHSDPIVTTENSEACSLQPS